MAPWILAVLLIAIAVGIVAVVSRRAAARRAYGPKGVGQALEHGRARVRDARRRERDG